jgi:hypothetical protein
VVAIWGVKVREGESSDSDFPNFCKNLSFGGSKALPPEPLKRSLLRRGERGRLFFFFISKSILKEFFLLKLFRFLPHRLAP